MVFGYGTYGICFRNMMLFCHDKDTIKWVTVGLLLDCEHAFFVVIYHQLANTCNGECTNNCDILLISEHDKDIMLMTFRPTFKKSRETTSYMMYNM